MLYEVYQYEDDFSDVSNVSFSSVDFEEAQNYVSINYENNYCIILNLTAKETETAVREFENFKNRKGDYWEMGINYSKTKISDFITLYFGYNGDEGLYLEIDGVKGTNKNITEKIKKLFSVIEYHDTFSQCGIELKQHNDIIFIYGFDY